jgi:hypothetical protein
VADIGEAATYLLSLADGSGRLRDPKPAATS